MLSHDVLGDPDARHSVWFVHGILGRGRNWRTFARRWVDRHTGWNAVTLDLRNHGDSQGAQEPHTLEACANDVLQLTRRLGMPHALVGHSFGGKVAIRTAAQLGSRAPTTLLLDCPPGVNTGRDPKEPTSPESVFEVLRSTPTPAENRAILRDHLVAAGLPRPVVAWLLTSATKTPAGWDWVWNLDGVQQMLADYERWDGWPSVSQNPGVFAMLRGGASQHWNAPERSRASALAKRSDMIFHTLEGAGHLVHVDDPAGTFDWVSATILRATA